MAANDLTGRLPPFPDDVPTHTLLVIDYGKLKAGDRIEQDVLWDACTTLDFFCMPFFILKNHGIDTQPMWEMGEVTMAMPIEEKMKYEQGNSGSSFGYKAAGANAADEMAIVSKDDALARPNIAHRVYPPSVEKYMPAIRTYVEASETIHRTLLDFMSDRLGLPREVLREKHDSNAYSGCDARITLSPPMTMSKEQIALGDHTDIGSLSILHNILGGLQVLPPGTKDWKYVKPLTGHAICNIGDTLAIFSGGILRSSHHRVIPPPGRQSQFSRWSLVYFLRPVPYVILEPLTQSPLISEAAQKNKLNIGENVTAGEWYIRRKSNLRIANRKGPETWKASRGTEFMLEAA
ncbi:Clavaminate synthase-like protein [Ramaria rubella]|nr:Clavaminate synthase-like protein [Ramaria rubella]